MNPIPKTSYPNLIDLINLTYTDEVEQILSAGVDDDDNIICIAQDGTKQLAIQITDSDIKIKLYNPTAQFAEQPDVPNQIADNLQKIGDPIVGGWLRQIEQMLTTSDDLESARESLFQLYPDLDGAELTTQMTDAVAVASMAGFWDAESEGDEAEFARIPEGTIRRRNGVDYVLRGSRWHAPGDEDDGLSDYENRTKPIAPRKALSGLQDASDPKLLAHLQKKYSNLEDVYYYINKNLSNEYGDLQSMAQNKLDLIKAAKAKPLNIPVAQAEINDAKTGSKLIHLADKHNSLANFFSDISDYDRSNEHTALSVLAQERLGDIGNYIKVEAAKANPKAKFITKEEGMKAISNATAEAHLEHLESKFSVLSNFFQADADSSKSNLYERLSLAAMDKRIQTRSNRLEKEQNYKIKSTDGGFDINVKPLTGGDEGGDWSAEEHSWSFTKSGKDWIVDKSPVAVNRVGSNRKEIRPGQKFKASDFQASLLNKMDASSSQLDTDDLLRSIRSDRLKGAQFAMYQEG